MSLTASPPQTLTLTILLLVSLLSPASADAGRAAAMAAVFALGDSSVNCGDNSFLYPFLSSNSSSFLCNSTSPRLLVPDLLAEKMGMGEVPTFYGQNGTAEGLMSGLNLGGSPATILKWGWLGFAGLNQQARQLFETLQLLQLRLGLDRADSFSRSSLYYLSIGADDLLHLRADPDVRRRFSPHQFARLLADQMTRVVKDLYDANARSIVCVGIGPIGCAPRLLWESFNSSASEIINGGCADETNMIAVEYNSVLYWNLRRLSLVKRDARIVFCDVYSGIMQIMSHPRVYGFANIRDACCGLGRFGGMVGCVSEKLMCKDQSKYVWWDLYNPTEAVNRLLAEWMWSGTPMSICRPFSIRELVSSSPISTTSYS